MTQTDFPTATSHPFYMRLNQLLREHRFAKASDIGTPRTLQGRMAALGTWLSVVWALIDNAMTATGSYRRGHARSASISFGFAVAESVA